MSRNPMLGNCSPWSWALELVRGCNLRCGHYAVRLFKSDEIQFITEEIWIALWKIIRIVTPRSRVEMANAGELTLHPELPCFIQLARKLSSECIRCNITFSRSDMRCWTDEQLRNYWDGSKWIDMNTGRAQA